MKSIYTDSIPNGTKLVAFYHDGSGAGLFIVKLDGHLFNSEGEDISSSPDVWLLDAGYTNWMPILKTFKLWFEI